MAKSEAFKRLTEVNGRRVDVSIRIVKAARPLIPVLLDAGRGNSAKELQELFFELDAIEEETLSYIKSDPTRAFTALIELLDESR